MGSFELVIDSSCDLQLDKVKEIGVKYVPYNVSPDGEHYSKDWIELDPKEYVKLLAANPDWHPKSATPSPELYQEAFESIIESGKTVLCLCGEPSLTSSIRSAETAKTIVLEKYPDAKIHVFDTQNMTFGLAEIILQAVTLRDNGHDAEDVIKKIEAVKKYAQIFFFCQSTKNLHRGGRIGKAAYLATDFLNIKPVIIFKNGEVGALGMVRSRKNGMLKLVAAVKEYLGKVELLKEQVSICIASTYDVFEEQAVLAKLIESEVGVTVKRFGGIIGSTILTHTGLGSLGVCVYKEIAE